MRGMISGVVAVVMAAAILTSHCGAQEQAPARPSVEVVFVLDTTGSMSGLINAAKEKVWAIANTLATADPAPDIKMGLVGYRDRGDAYVTRLTPLTDDLDAVYTSLMDFQADGGGDTPESVNQALHEAVTRMDWSKDETTYRVIFLVGDCPPHMDYKDDVAYPDTCKAAATAGIIVNTIQCGGHGATVPIWQEIAERAEGEYFRVEQSGGAILAATPFDAELADLSRELDGTRLYYGAARAAGLERKEAADAIHAGATVTAKARRGAFYAMEAGRRSFAGEGELVQALADGRADLDDIAAEDLPENMREMSPEEQKAHVKELAEKREALQKRIAELAGKRDAHLKEQVAKSAAKGADSLDYGIYECIRVQAAEKGIACEGGPSL